MAEHSISFCRRILLTAGSLLLCTAGLASDEKVEQAVYSFLQEQTRHMEGEVHISIHDSATRFPQCETPQAFFPHSHTQSLLGRISVGVKCAESSNARYLTAQIEVLGPYLQLQRNVDRGELITADMLDTVTGELSRLPSGTLLTSAEALGRVATRPLQAGVPLRSQDIRRLPLVERGQGVVVESQGAGFTVSRKGEAMESGGLGDIIRVRLSRHETRATRVSGQGRVKIK